jgi:D-tyrosyl-tRNA(Tyr) deacylase
VKLVIQRVKWARVSTSDQVRAEIGPGVLILVGVGHQDGAEAASFLAEKAASLRIFEDGEGKTNLSLLDTGGEALVVSQFTLYAETSRGRRPSFTQAAHPEPAKLLIEQFADHLASQGVPTKLGVFGAHMQVELLNDGPMTIILDK